MLKPISEIQIKGKTILVRADLNSSVKNRKIISGQRLKEHSKTLLMLSSKKAKTVVLSHQGRKERDDFISLKNHLSILEELTGKKIQFSSWKENFKQKISALKEEEILLMENTRFLEFESEEKTPEEHSKQKIIQELASVADAFVLDALSVSHRSHASVVGFIPLIPSFSGPVLDSELINLDKALNFKESPRVLFLGGAKPEDSIKTLSFFLKENKTDKALLSGILGELFLSAQGIKFGAKDSFFESKNYFELIPEIKEIHSSFKEKIFLPEDFALNKNKKRKNLSAENLPSDFETKDIGKKTIQKFSEEIKKAKMIVFNGPPGVFEEKEFSLGTKSVFQAMKENSCFTFLGGGDTGTALISLGFSPCDFSFVSLSGKASLKYLSGKKLVAVEALKQSKLKLK